MGHRPKAEHASATRATPDSPAMSNAVVRDIAARASARAMLLGGVSKTGAFAVFVFIFFYCIYFFGCGETARSA